MVTSSFNRISLSRFNKSVAASISTSFYSIAYSALTAGILAFLLTFVQVMIKDLDNSFFGYFNIEVDAFEEAEFECLATSFSLSVVNVIYITYLVLRASFVRIRETTAYYLNYELN